MELFSTQRYWMNKWLVNYKYIYSPYDSSLVDLPWCFFFFQVNCCVLRSSLFWSQFWKLPVSWFPVRKYTMGPYELTKNTVIDVNFKNELCLREPLSGLLVDTVNAPAAPATRVCCCCCCCCCRRTPQMPLSLREAQKTLTHLSLVVFPCLAFCCSYSDITAGAVWPVSSARRGGRCFSTTRGVAENSSFHTHKAIWSVVFCLFEGEI